MLTTRTDVDDAAAGGIEIFQRFLRGQQQAEHIQIELLVEMLLGDLFERREFIDARVVHEHVQLAEGFLGFGEQTFDVRLFGDVALHGDRLAARAGDFGDDLVRARFAGSVIDDDRRAFRREMLGDGRADAFGRARDDRDFAREFFDVLCSYVCSFCFWLLLFGY